MSDWFNYQELEEKAYNDFWTSMGGNQGYISEPCPECGRYRVEHWGCGKDICEKCHWCVQDNAYFRNEYFDY